MAAARHRLWPRLDVGLQIATSIDDQVDENAAASDAVDHAVGFERGLAKFLDAQRQEFPGVAAVLGETDQAICDHQQAVKNTVGAGDASRNTVGMVGRGRLELPTNGLKVRCSTD